MNYFADSAAEYIVTQMDSLSKAGGQSRLLMMVPSLPAKVTLDLGKRLDSICIQNGRWELVFKVAKNLAAEWPVSPELQQMEIFTRSGTEIEEGEVLLDVNLFDLLGALSHVLERLKEEPVREIVSDEITVKEKITFIVDVLMKDNVVNFTTVFAGCSSRSEAIVTFLALLELIKLQEVRVKQKRQFAEIYLHRVEKAA